MKSIRNIALIGLIFHALCISAQVHFPQNGPADDYKSAYLLDNATIISSWDAVPMTGDILIRDGKIASLGSEIDPGNARVVPMDGRYIYPSFIDLYTQYGLGKLDKGSSGPHEQFNSDKPGAFAWNEAIRSEFRAHEDFAPDAKAAKELRDAGFGTVLTHRMDGISRGSGTAVLLADMPAHEVFVKPLVSHHLSLLKGSSSQTYPGSQMGAIALLRQTHLDGQWYLQQSELRDFSLDGWIRLQGIPTIFESSNVLESLRADRIGDEFGIQYIIKGSGEEYQRLEGVHATGAPFIVPVNYPSAFDVEDPWDAEYVNLEQMMHWELAPYNLARLDERGVPFAITTAGLKEVKDFLPNVRKAVQKGLKESSALKALTQTPAALLGVDDQVGSIAVGKWANLLITSAPIFSEDAKLYQNWVKGQPYEITATPYTELVGTYWLKVATDSVEMELSMDGEKWKLSMTIDSTAVKGTFTPEKFNQVSMQATFPENAPWHGRLTFSGWWNGNGFEGSGRMADGSPFEWRAVGIPTEVAVQDTTKTMETAGDSTGNAPETIGPVIYPFASYGWEDAPPADRVIIRNATVWTNERQGILEGADVLIDDGKILRVGKNISDQRARVVDGTGKHLTSGIIDEHSHIGIGGGVNEWTQASSAEVRIGDVINSEDVNIYRQLAGGVTAVQQLHGSSNPIGGQSALVKLRWGSLPEHMKIQGADGFIKFALGENVKRGNSSGVNERFPNSRMGVEQVFIDYFTRAKEYDPSTDRRDLDLETVREVLDGHRFITCHAYVQSEINMLMKLAERFGFRINTYTHILEGYKVADKMEEHGVAASTFSDWWGYKFEVMEATPYNAALLTEMGVLTAINSDDAEMGRRLNQEAAKGVRYGGMSEEEAWKMVTLNPAIMLHLDDRMGSIREGKDADLVLWSENPLSVYAVVEQTYIDGRKYYDRVENAQRKDWIVKERARLIQKMLDAKHGGAEVVKPKPEHDPDHHCDDIDDWGKH